MKLFVGNISFNATEDGLRSLFARYGNVERVTILKDRNSGESRGFGFVEMSDDGAGRKAIDALNRTDFLGRKLNVNEARPKEDRGDRGGGERRYSRY